MFTAVSGASPVTRNIVSIFDADFNPQHLESQPPKQKKIALERAFRIFSFAMKIGHEATRHLSRGDYTWFEASVGNFGCQNVAFRIHELARSTRFREECVLMHRVYTEFVDSIGLIDSNNWQNKAEKCEKKCISLFNHSWKEMAISSDMADLLHAYLLTVGRPRTLTEENRHEEQGIDYRALESKYPDSGVSGKQLQSAVSKAKRSLADNCIAFTRSQAYKIHSMPQEERDIVNGMLDEEHIVEYAPGHVVRLPFASTYYTVKAILARLRETGGIIAFKKYLPTSGGLFYRAVSPNGPFRRLTAAEVAAMDRTLPVFVLGVECRRDVDLDDPDGRALFATKVARYGLENIVLSGAAKGVQFVPVDEDRRRPSGSPAFQQGENYRQKETTAFDTQVRRASESDYREPFMDMIHIYPGSIHNQMVTSIAERATAATTASSDYEALRDSPRIGQQVWSFLNASPSEERSTYNKFLILENAGNNE